GRESLEGLGREFERVGGVLHRVAEAGEVVDVVARIAAERAMDKVVAWPGATLGLDVTTPLAARGLRATVMPGAEVGPVEQERLRTLSAAAQLGVTGADVAIAATVPLVGVSCAGCLRSPSLLPACLLAVLFSP